MTMINEIEIHDRAGVRKIERYGNNGESAIIPFRDVAGEMIRLPTNGETDANALIGIGATSEKSTPNERAIATGKKMFYGMITSAAVVVALAFTGLDVTTLAIIEVVGCVIAFGIALWLDQRDSPLATERSKAKDYRAIRLGEIASQERMFNRRMDGLERIIGGFFNADYRKDK